MGAAVTSLSKLLGVLDYYMEEEPDTYRIVILPGIVRLISSRPNINVTLMGSLLHTVDSSVLNLTDSDYVQVEDIDWDLVPHSLLELRNHLVDPGNCMGVYKRIYNNLRSMMTSIPPGGLTYTWKTNYAGMYEEYGWSYVADSSRITAMEFIDIVSDE